MAFLRSFGSRRTRSRPFDFLLYTKLDTSVLADGFAVIHCQDCCAFPQILRHWDGKPMLSFNSGYILLNVRSGSMLPCAPVSILTMSEADCWFVAPLSYFFPVVWLTTLLALGAMGRTVVSSWPMAATAELAGLAVHVTLVLRLVSIVVDCGHVAEGVHISQRCFVSPGYIHGTV